MPIKNKRLITIDLDDTLWPLMPTLIKADQNFKQWLNHKFPEYNNFFTYKNMFAMKEDVVKENPELEIKISELRLVILDKMFKEKGHNSLEAKKLAEEGFEAFYEKRNEVAFYPGAISLLSNIAKHYHLIALTNGNANLKRIGIDQYFDTHLSAEIVGKKKPHAAMFNKALQHAGAMAKEAIHIGDHPLEDIEGARNNGFDAIWVNLNNQTWPKELTPAPTVKSLDALHHLLMI